MEESHNGHRLFSIFPFLVIYFHCTITPWLLRTKQSSGFKREERRKYIVSVLKKLLRDGRAEVDDGLMLVFWCFQYARWEWNVSFLLKNKTRHRHLMKSENCWIRTWNRTCIIDWCHDSGETRFQESTSFNKDSWTQQDEQSIVFSLEYLGTQ